MIRLPAFPDRRSVYVFNVKPVNAVIPFLWIGKVGFSVDADVRAADVERSIWQTTGVQVRVSRFFHVRVFAYRAIEKAIHTVIKPYRSNRFEGASGWTEMFTILNIFTGLLCYIGFWALSIPCASWLCLCIMVLPWPIDFAVFVAVLAAFEYAVCGLLMWVAYVIGISLFSFL